jgi:putative transposase
MIPSREAATNNGQTYFVTSNTAERKPFFRHERWARLFIETLYGYRPERYLIHGFVLMPDHFHLLMTPKASLELAVQCLKGGFSFRAKREFKWAGDIWVTGYSDHRIRNEQDFRIHLTYISSNSVKARLVEGAEQYAYSSAGGCFELDAFPRGLKPGDSLSTSIGAAKAAPFQSNETCLGRSWGEWRSDPALRSPRYSRRALSKHGALSRCCVLSKPRQLFSEPQ